MQDEAADPIIAFALTFFEVDPGEFRRGARGIAASLDTNRARELFARYGEFDTRTVAPDAFRPETENPISRWYAWTAIWSETLREILHQAAEKALPVLREAGFGDPRVTGNAAAFDLLCQLAAEGVGLEQFFSDLDREFPAMDEDARTSAVDSLWQHERVPHPTRTPPHWPAWMRRHEPHREEFSTRVAALWERPEFRDAKEALSRIGEEPQSPEN